MLRFGSLTSPAVKVMLFQASAETANLFALRRYRTNNPNAVCRRQASTKVVKRARTLPQAAKVRGRAPEREPINKPRTMSPNSAASFVVVKVFCTNLPSFKPPRVHKREQNDQEHAN